ncbi:gem (nuclear organelle) associated protein 2 [Coemansia sp. RSA 2399]|nr:gem (nuclear organelle) associated protein 2 [Coemansia sp. RSA 2399]KAJ1908226.1 gem (nuclear organelle) associated protein 2 [Coemansia sp. IMI 209127]
MGDATSNQRNALPIPDNVTAGDLSIDPESGEQYMLRVRMEAVSMPSVSVAENREQMLLATMNKDKSHFASTGPCGKNEELPLADFVKPSERWLARFSSWFVAQRKRLVRVLDQTNVPDDFDLPGNGQVREWKALCYEASRHSETNSAILLHTLAAIDQVMAMRLIKWITSWLATDKLQRAEGIWLWHLVLRLDALLDHDDIHALRELCRKLGRIRANIGCSSPQDSVPTTLLYRGDEIAATNILIASVTRGYGQRDLD